MHKIPQTAYLASFYKRQGNRWNVFGCVERGMQWTREMDQGAGLLLSACREDYQWRQVGKCAGIWYKRIQPTETVEV